MKGFDPEVYGTAPSCIPPYLAFVDPWLGEVAVDMRYGDLDGDGLPDVSVGRLAANSLADANVIVDKIVNYDESARTADWQRRALFVADNHDPAGNFPALSDEIVTGYLPSDLAVTRAYLPGKIPGNPCDGGADCGHEKDNFRHASRRRLAGAVYGPRSAQFWASRTAADSGLMSQASTTASRLPIIMSFNCLDGWFVRSEIVSTRPWLRCMQRQNGWRRSRRHLTHR